MPDYVCYEQFSLFEIDVAGTKLVSNSNNLF